MEKQMTTCPHCCRHLAITVYVAARYEDREDAISVKKYLEDHGFVVNSRWLLPNDDDQPMEKIKKTPALCEELSKVAEQDIWHCDVLVVLSPEKAHRNGTGGRHTEVGIAIGMRRAVVLYGIPENVFHYRTAIPTVPWGDSRSLPHAIRTAYEKSRQNDFMRGIL